MVYREAQVTRKKTDPLESQKSETCAPDRSHFDPIYDFWVYYGRARVTPSVQ